MQNMGYCGFDSTSKRRAAVRSSNDLSVHYSYADVDVHLTGIATGVYIYIYIYIYIYLDL